MTKIRVDTITDAAGTGAPNIPDGVTIGGVALASINSLEYTESASEPASPKDGAIWWDTGNDKFFQYMNDAWVEISYTDIPPVWYGDRAVFGAGFSTVVLSSTEYVQISTLSNATDFSTLTLAASDRSACSDGNNAYFGGGTTNASNSGAVNVIDYLSFSTAGTATDFGDLTLSRIGASACSNGSIGVFGGGQETSGSWTNVIDYITFATPGNAIDFGDLTLARPNSGCAGNGVRGIFGGGGVAFAVRSNIDYITIATTGNATSFGNLSGRANLAACSDSTRVVFSSGTSNSGTVLNVVDYVTIDTLGDATSFGTMSIGRRIVSGTSNNERGVFGGGFISANSNIIDYITIQTLGNTTDFGDLVVARRALSACSGD